MIEALRAVPFVHGPAPAAYRLGCQNAGIARILLLNKTRQGYARERILKPAGYFFVRPKSAAQNCVGGGQ